MVSQAPYAGHAEKMTDMELLKVMITCPASDHGTVACSRMRIVAGVLVT